jgi:hypothetical protein
VKAGDEMRKTGERTKKQLAASARFDEYRRFDDAFNCTFKEWLKIRKTQWYDDLKHDRLRHPELEGC